MNITIYDKLAMCFGLAALCIILMFLVISWDSCFILFEPKLWIKIPEIIIAIFGIYYLIKLIFFKK